MPSRSGKLRALVVGSINMDLLLEMERVPVVGENLMGRRYSYLPGGKGANQAVAAARLGAQVTFVGRVGSDVHAERLIASLAADGIGTQFVTVTEEAPTGLAVICVEANGENRIVVYPGANMTLDASHVRVAFQEAFDIVMLQLEVPDAVVLAALEVAERLAIPVVLDAGPARPFDLTLARGLQILSPNQSEAAALTGLPCDSVEQAETAARALAAKSDAHSVVVKLGSLGALVFSEGRASHVPAFEVDAVDPTAAGDAFTAALALHWLEGKDIIASARYGNAAGALAASKLGAQPSLPDRDAVVAFAGCAAQKQAGPRR